MGQTARTAATTSFTLDAQARRYRDLYARLIAREPEVRIPVTLFAETNVDSFDWALNVLEQQKSVLEQEKAVLEQEKAALTQEKAALTQKRAALAHEKIALMEENCMLARQTSDLKSELSRLRKWNHYLRRQSLVEFASRNMRVRRRFERKRWAYTLEKWRRANSLIRKLFLKVTHFHRKT